MVPNQFAGPPAPQGPTVGPPQNAAPAPNNMLSQGAPPQQQPIVPPSPEMMKEALTKQSMMAATLKQLLSKPDLSVKDILDSTGELVAEQVFSPFAAAKSLADLPPDGDSLALRQWVGQHYANATQSMRAVSSMLAAHGEMMRRQAGIPPSPQPQQAAAPMVPPAAPQGMPPPAPANQFSGAQ